MNEEYKCPYCGQNEYAKSNKIEAVAQLKTNASSEAKTKSKVINEPKNVPKQTTGNEASNPTEAPKDAESFHLWNIQNNLKNKRS